MKYFALWAMLICTATTAFCQDLAGYYITDTNTRIDGFFKPVKFLDPAVPLTFSRDGTTFTIVNLSHIKEYGIAGDYKFVRYDVDFDTSEEASAGASIEKDPVYVNKSLFLNVITEGDATLYSGNVNGRIKYFYKMQSSVAAAPVQLVYKKYMVQGRVNSFEGENNRFRNQLYDNLKCGDDKFNVLDKMPYRFKDLKAFFEDYNTCKGGNKATYANAAKNSAKIQFTLFAGVGIESFGMKEARPQPAKSHDPVVSGGVEVNLLLPNNSWGFFLKAEYEKLSTSTISSDQSTTITYISHYQLKYSVINLHFGPRYYFKTGPLHRFFVDGAFALAVPKGTINSGVNAGALITSFKLAPTTFFNFGVGYAYKNKYGADLRFDTNKNLIGTDNTPASILLAKVGLNLRYTFN